MIEEIKGKAKEITINFRGKDYTHSKVDKLWDDIRERIKSHYNVTQDKEEKLARTKACKQKINPSLFLK